MLNEIGDAVLASVGKVLPQSAINGIGRIENAVSNAVLPLAKKSTFKYFSGAADKADKAGNIAKEFVTFCQTYIYIPTLIVVVICAFIFAFGNPQEKTGAKHKMLWVVFGIAMVMSAMTIVSIIMGFMTADTASDLKV
jgi:hypothetical protein